MYMTNEDGTYEKKGHAIVIHGCQTIEYGGQNLDGFIAHHGWGWNTWNYWVNADWFNGYLTFQTTHTHTDEVFPTDNENMYGHVLECLICHRTRVNTQHKWRLSIPLSEEDGGYDVQHMSYCYCGYQARKRHSTVCKPINKEYHRITCECGYEKDEAHLGKHGSCWGCGCPI